MRFHRNAKPSRLAVPQSPLEMRAGRGTKTLVAHGLPVVATVLGIVIVASSLSLAEKPKPTDAPKRVSVARHQFAPIGKPYFFA